MAVCLRRRSSIRLLERRGELGCLHVIGIAAKGVVAPGRVDGIFSRMAQSAECREMDVCDAVLLQGLAQGSAFKLRIFSGAWNGADIGELLDAELFQQTGEFTGSARGMSDCVDSSSWSGLDAQHLFRINMIELHGKALAGIISRPLILIVFGRDVAGFASGEILHRFVPVGEIGDHPLGGS